MLKPERTKTWIAAPDSIVPIETILLGRETIVP